MQRHVEASTLRLEGLISAVQTLQIPSGTSSGGGGGADEATSQRVVASIAVGETVVLPPPPLLLVDVSMWMERRCQ